MALTPSYLQKCTDGIEKDFQDLVTEILVDMADRIAHAGSMTSTTEYLNEKLRVLSLQQKYINQALAKLLNKSEADIEKLMEESTYKSTRETMANLEAHGYDTSGLEFADQILKSTNVAKGELQNLTRTTGQLATSKMTQLYDQAYLQVASGAYSYDQAVTNAVKKLAKEGLDEVTYPTGTTRSVEAAVRVAVRTSVAQNALQCEEDMLDEMDVNLVEVSSHLGARPSHAVWQGKVYWRKYPEKNYDNFYEATGYGTPTGLGGYNCRHQFYAFFGDDDEQTYHHIDETLNEKYYKMEQQQRAYERKMRKWDREEKVLKAGGQDTTEAQRWKSYYKGKLNSLVKNSDGFLKRDYSAEKAWSGYKQRHDLQTYGTIKPKNGTAAKQVSYSFLKNTSKNAIAMAQPYTTYERYIKNTLPKILQANNTGSKSDWIKILEQNNFKSEYKVTRTPEILKSYGIDTDIILTLSNLAYILSRHSSEYSLDTYLQMKSTIEDYDLLLSGNQSGNRDFRFYRLFTEEGETNPYGIEVVIDRQVSSTMEFVVHLNYIGKKKNKAQKLYRKLMNDSHLIDTKK